MKYPSTPTLAEDLLLVLFQPDSGAIAGESALSHVLAGAVLAELALNESVTTTLPPTGSATVEAVAGRAPSDEILCSAWDHAAGKPRVVQTVLAAIGPTLRQPLLERLIARGDIREENGKVLGMLKIITLKDGGSGRRSDLIEGVRKVLVDGMEPTPRSAALAALIWASGTLREFHPELPWSPVVTTRAQELARGDWQAEGTTQAVARATAAMFGSIAASVPPPSKGQG